VRHASEEDRGGVIDDEPGNTRKYPETSAEALSQGEGGAGFPLLPDLRQGLSGRCAVICLPASAGQSGSAGGDGQTFVMIEVAGLEEWLSGLQEELRTKTYNPQPVRGMMIPKPGGGARPLGIPTIRDGVVQMAAKLIIEPIFEADLDLAAYGYRPQRSAQDALKEVDTRLCQGYYEVVDADLSCYFRPKRIFLSKWTWTQESRNEEGENFRLESRKLFPRTTGRLRESLAGSYMPIKFIQRRELYSLF
jgi:hypothetical protein